MRLRFTSFCLFALLAGVVLSSGCFSGGGGGGGGGGARQVPPDLPALQRTLDGFFAAMARRNDRQAVDYFSPRAQVSGEASTRLRHLYVRDFGHDIYNPADDASYTFTINLDEIHWDGGRYVVPAQYTSLSGSTMTIMFYMIYVQGRYFIDEIGFDDGGASLSVNAPLAEYFPLLAGNKYFYAEESNGARLTTSGILMAVGSPVTIDGRQVFPLTRSSISYTELNSVFPEPGVPYANGVAIPSLRFAAGNVKADIFPGNEASYGLGTYRFALVPGDGLYYYGPNSSFNGGRPWKVLNDPVVTGSELVATVTFSFNGETITCVKITTVKPLEILSALPVAQNDQAAVLPIEIETVYPNPVNAYTRATGITEEFHVLYLLKKVGMAGFREEIAGRPSYAQYLYKALVAGKTLANPTTIGTSTYVIAGGPTLILPPAAVGVPYSYTFTTESGPNPATWEIIAGALPPGLILQSVGANGLISGTPTRVGLSSFDIAVRDSMGYGAASCTLKVLDRLNYVATQTALTTVVVTYDRDPDPTQAAQASRYLLIDADINRADKTLVNRTVISAQSVSFNAANRQATVVFPGGSIDPLKATQKVIVSNVFDTSGSYLASGPEVILGGRLVFHDFLPWSMMTNKGIPKKVYLPRTDQSRLFLMYEDVVQEFQINISPERKMTVDGGTNWFTTLDLNYFIVYDIGAKYAIDGNFLGLQALTQGLPPYDGLYYHRQVNPTGLLASVPLGVDPWGAPPYFAITASFPLVSRDVVAMGDEMRLYDAGVTPPYSSMLASQSLTGQILAIDSGRTPPDTTEVFWTITSDRQLRAVLVPESGVPLYSSLYLGSWHTLPTGPTATFNTRYGLDWLEDPYEFLIADLDRNRIGRYAQPSNFNGGALIPMWEIGHDDTAADYLGSVTEPFFIKEYQGKIIVGDRGGLTLYEYML